MSLASHLSPDLGEGLRNLSVQFVPFMMAVVFHEYAHGFVAHRWGDDTAQEQGRLTLNPLPHLDLLWTVVFPIIMMVTGAGILFGWAKPVPIDPRRFRKFRPALFWVSIAGVTMNFILANLSAALFCSIQLWMPQDSFLYEPLSHMTIAGITINYALGIFNLVPLPPLDGSKIIESFLSYPMIQKFERLTQYSFFILLALMFTGALSILSYPITFMSKASIFIMAHLFGIPGVL